MAPLAPFFFLLLLPLFSVSTNAANYRDYTG
jgi:hypothetical protein